MEKTVLFMLREYFFFPIIAGLLIFSEHQPINTPGILEETVNKFYSFQSKFPQQKIYIHTDKPYYLGGDDMYGKLYLINESRFGYDGTRSKKIYVELINEENTVVKKAIVNGLASSLNFSFHLEDSVAEGYYLLRAYTSWMIGINKEQNIFSKYIHISSSTNHLVSSLSYTDSSLATVSIQVKDTLKNVYTTLPVQYQLIYKDQVKDKGEINPGQEGRYLINVGSIPKEDRNDAVIKISTGNYKRTIHFPSLNDDIDLQFFAEGGNLVNEVENTVAFKAINKQGRGTNVEGYVKDSQGMIVCRFKSSHLGMGRFYFIPQSETSYIACVPYGNGRELTYPLPAVDKYASQVAIIKRSKNELRVRVALGDSLYKKNVTTYIVVTSHGGVYFTSRGTDLYEVNIPLTGLPEGIAQLSLFDNEMRPVSERLVYVHHPNSVVHISTDKNNYRKREKVSMPLTVTDPDGKQLAGIYSVSVTDDHIVKTDENEENIKTHLLLSPYLKGHIEEPGYYFNNETATTMDNLDLVMLTHGWSRFTWNDIKSDAALQLPPKDSSLAISGKLVNGKTPASHYAVSLFSVSDNNYIGTDTTNEKGEFHFTGIDFTDSTSFFIQTKNRKGFNETLDVSIDPLHFPLTSVDRSYPPQEADLGIVNGANFYKRFMYDLVKSDKILLLKEVTIASTKRKINFDESRRVSQVSHIITSDLITRFGNFLNLTEILYSVPGVTITDGHISFFGLNSMSNYTDPLYFLDGVESSGALTIINPFEIDFIEVLRGGEAAIYGMRGANGVVLVNTKKGKDIVLYFTQKGIKALQAPGYHVEKDFYAPRYETEESKLAKTNDERTTIYWNGNITTDSKTPAIISFYTADMPTTYTITIEGIAENGEAIHQTFPLKRTRL